MQEHGALPRKTILNPEVSAAQDSNLMNRKGGGCFYKHT
jgi:hypothetical protein